MKYNLYLALLLAAAMTSNGCDSANASLSASAEDRLDALEKRVERIEKNQAKAKRPARPKRPDPAVRYRIPVDETDAYRGGAHAKVTIIEAYEYACPYCALIEPLMSSVLEAYDDADVKVVSKQFVVHPNRATDPALAVCAAQAQGRFAEFNEVLWAKAWPTAGGRPRMVADQLERAALVAMAKEVGMNEAEFVRALDSQACKKKLRDDRTALSRIGVGGTPYIFINGKYYNGPRSADGLKAAIDREIAEADRIMAKGVALDQYYAHLMKSARPSL